MVNHRLYLGIKLTRYSLHLCTRELNIHYTSYIYTKYFHIKVTLFIMLTENSYFLVQIAHIGTI